MRRSASGLLGMVRPLGWVALGGGVLLLLAGVALGWAELAVLGVAALVVLLLALPWLLGSTRVEMELLLEPERVTAGGTVTASLGVTNRAQRRTRSLLLDLPVGASTQRYDLPGLAPGAHHEETFTIRTQRRGVIPVGPAITRRADPLGLVSRDVRTSAVREVLVRPQVVALASLGGGLLRDLEGVSTESVSQADLAFHALREYVPGDDLRHVHWRSSAKLAGSGSGGLLVRQYLDTRRSHATLVVDDAEGDWASEDDFETAMEVVASIVMRALLDEFGTTLVCGEHAGHGRRALDTACRAGWGGPGLLPAARAAASAAPDTSLLFLLGGEGTALETLRRAAACFEPEVRRIAIRVEPVEKSSVSAIDDLTVLHLAARDDLAGLLRWSLG
ncbi:DUF58 domain-containing protein [Nocardioides sp. BP30]|uniref:DUF58 domain-containing protein n=1 Tax=Nocardioides sp. BP30 TaxID=3036374 RepID=UPI0024684DC6|nr:DUF58 domain-containing protein [Nocardioides sp. BP30]WGL53223.1 DUF58 domain-containing protein [Nocardioides sp. BP30]